MRVGLQPAAAALLVLAKLAFAVVGAVGLLGGHRQPPWYGGGLVAVAAQPAKHAGRLVTGGLLVGGQELLGLLAGGAGPGGFPGGGVGGPGRFPGGGGGGPGGVGGGAGPARPATRPWTAAGDPGCWGCRWPTSGRQPATAPGPAAGSRRAGPDRAGPAPRRLGARGRPPHTGGCPGGPGTAAHTASSRPRCRSIARGPG